MIGKKELHLTEEEKKLVAVLRDPVKGPVLLDIKRNSSHKIDIHKAGNEYAE